jgi:photosystem II stability/assembly factor-like uncharacterized protein
MPTRPSTYAAVAIALLLAAAPARAATTYSWAHPRPQGNGIYGLAFADAAHGWAVGGAGTVLATQDGGESWSLLQGPDLAAGDLNDVVVLPGGVLIAAGDGIRRSTDGGVTWTAIASPATGSLRDLASYPGGISAAGEDGVVLISTDDGLTWDDVGPGLGTIRHHLWRSATEGYAVGFGVSHRTTDGGATWTHMTDDASFGFNEVYFTDATHGTIVEDFATWRSADGGATWTEFFNPVPPLYRFRTVVLSPTHLIAAVFIEGGELWETLDGGANWTQLQQRMVVGFPCVVQAPGGRLHWASDIGDLFWSDDLGHTIHNAATNLCEDALAVPIVTFVARPDGVIFAANQPNSGEQTQAWLRSDDEGATWTAPATTPGFWWIGAGGFADAMHGLVTYNQWLRLTDDGGATWTPAELAADRRIWSAALPALDRYYLATTRTGGGGDLLKSTTGGQSWTPAGGGVPTGTFAASVVTFADPTTGFASGTVGAAPRLYRTLDGGATWQLRTATGLPAQPAAMHWFDASVGLAGINQFENPGIYRTTDGGDHWALVDPQRTTALAFRDALHGIALGLYTESARVTDDGGLTWTEEVVPIRTPGPGFQVASVTAVTPRHDGWVLGGSSNRILVATETDLTPVPDAGPVVQSAEGCQFLGASPNPFNPMTTIAFATATAGPVRVTIHDLTGARVRKLLEEPRPAGEHRAIWDGKDDGGQMVAAGVYLVRVANVYGSGHGTVVLVK